MGQAGGYYDAAGNYRTGLTSNPTYLQGRQTIQAGQDAMRAAGGFNGSAPQTPYTVNQPGDPFLAFGNGGGSQTGGVMNNLPNTINNTQNQYNNGQYTGFGGSVLTASGNPSYSGPANQGPGGGGGGGGGSPSNPSNVPGYYAGMPQTNTRPTVMPYLNTNQISVAPLYGTTYPTTTTAPSTGLKAPAGYGGN
jgi:hypothetical protein